MAVQGAKKPQLSKNVLGLKFMQRTVIRLEKEQNADENQRAIDDEHWVIARPVEKQEENLFEVNPSYVFCEELKFGRMSFLGCNPEIEKLMIVNELDHAEKRENEAAVDDEEMAYRFKNIVGSQKLKKKRDHMEILMDSVHEHSSRKKNKKNGFKTTFLKPADD
ncbi:MPHOSPH6 [Acanthosepion pharaonis]|uniref:MPHOSPH6 n=1 Tax=Acanthosepion pharaonis TaxID=158019 RepID=A0A812DB70_ACAPH|nr:MPHOSPH6 [Sepia pharaonis]